MNKNYKNGAAREYRIMKKLEQEGWFCIRSAGSHSPIDIIAMMPIAEHIKHLVKKAEKEKWDNKDWDKAQEQVLQLNIMKPNQDTVVGFQDEFVTVVRFIQSKKTGYLTPQEHREKEELEHRLGITIEVM